jgi:uncharacterized protein YegJ (DUF2314 family)
MKGLVLLLLLSLCLPVLGSDDKFYLRERDVPTVIKAFEKAKKHRDFFLNALEARETESSKYNYHGVYLKFTEGEVVEYLWLGDVQKYKDFYIGVIISEPQLLNETKNGITIGFYASDIYDWQLTERQTGKTLGAFLICSTSDDEYLKGTSFTCTL